MHALRGTPGSDLKAIMGTKGEYFNESDFVESDDENPTKKDKKITYKDVIRQDALQKIDSENSESSSEDEDIFKKHKGNKETIAEEQNRLKAEFK